MKRRIAQLPLHGGKAPSWLFGRMKELAGAVVMAVVDAYGPEEMLRRLADPWWFQAFGCALGFDWHSSGLTTVTCGALKEAARMHGDELGILVAGGKGKTSRRTPAEIAAAADRLGIAGGEKLIYASRTSAKVDSAAVQDGYQVYHHSFFFTPGGAWCVVQQGMNDRAGAARLYHWLGESVDDFVCEPHSAIADAAGDRGDRADLGAPAELPEAPGDLPLLNMVAREAGANRRASAELVRGSPEALLRELRRLTEGILNLIFPAVPAIISAVDPRRDGCGACARQRRPRTQDMEEREETHGEPEHRSEEELLWQSHPSHWVYFWRYVLCLVLIAGGIALMVWQHSNKYLLIAGLVLVGAGVIAFLIIHLCRTRTTLTVTSRNVSYEGGIFQRDAVDVPIHSITEMWVEQSLLQRLAGIGTIGFSSSASTETEIVCRGMPHPDRIRQIVRDHMS